MKQYKVLFVDNKAVSALVQEVKLNRSIQILRVGSRAFIEWFVVWGTDESDAMQVAEKVVFENLAPVLAKIKQPGQ